MSDTKRNDAELLRDMLEAIEKVEPKSKESSKNSKQNKEYQYYTPTIMMQVIKRDGHKEDVSFDKITARLRKMTYEIGRASCRERV